MMNLWIAIARDEEESNLTRLLPVSGSELYGDCHDLSPPVRVHIGGPNVTAKGNRDHALREPESGFRGISPTGWRPRGRDDRRRNFRLPKKR